MSSWGRTRQIKRRRITILLLCVLFLTGCETDEDKSGEDTEGDAQTKREEQTVPDLVITLEPDEEEEDKGEDTEDGTQPRKGILIAIDPGHQSPEIDMSGLEPNAPGSSEMKTKATGGTAGSFSGIPEYELNLEISLLLRAELEDRGYDVIMTREDNDTAISNAERAQLANDAGADISVRIHANGSEDQTVNGALVLIGSEENPYVGDLYENSLNLGTAVLDSYCHETGMNNLGVQTNDTMTGINWSDIPVIILEMGFMTNEQDDLNMADDDYRIKMAEGIANGIDIYYSENGSNKLEEVVQTAIRSESENGTRVSVYAEKIESGQSVSVNNGPMQSASLIKLFISGSVYEQLETLRESEAYEHETEELVKDMLSVSDNTAANTLVKRLGGGNAEKGMETVNVFCTENGYTDTSMGRLMLDLDAESDNYTSVQDCGKFLKDIYQNKLKGSQKILEDLKAQERVSKIPAGVPSEIETANKTGELDNVENDAAIVYGDSGAYILCVIMNDLQDTARGRNAIKSLSSDVYEYMDKN